jgi:UDP-N-acetylglucosamine--N-acetylmuramyl-(pentapeptide) pyrophosphoryl-undecaprenol N-acetylglucosamine transferase
MLANREKPCAMLGGGAYLSVPMGLAAWAMHVPISLLEINSVGGTANKLLSRFSDKIFLAYPESSKDFNASKKKITICGTPVRGDLGSSTSTAQQARAHFGLDPERETVLVFGGSLGARAINEAMQGCVDRLSARGYNVLWQCGKANDAEGLARAHNSNYVRVQEFIYEMNDAYRAADLVVCRAGASSLAELSTLGKPAILVPYPFAAANHQESNAKAFESAGAAVVLRDHELKTKLESQIIELLSDKSKLDAMARAMRERENKESAKIVAEWLIERCKNAQ